MTEPTRDALHAETLAWLAECERTSRILANSTGDLYGPTQHAKETRIIAHAAACVRRVPELEAEVERLRAELAGARQAAKYEADVAAQAIAELRRMREAVGLPHLDASPHPED